MTSGAALILEVVYADPGGLKHDAETQLARGGLYVAMDASALPPLCELTLRLRVDAATLEVPARLTVATGVAACVEIAPAAVPDLLAAIAIHTADATAQLGVVLARVIEATAAPPPLPDEPDDDSVDTRGQIPLDRKIAAMSVGEKVQLALHGNRDARQLLMRDRAGVVQSALVRSAKITLDEVQALARAPQLSPETAETLAQHPIYGVMPSIALALVRNPRTPLPTATLLVARLQPADLRAVAKGLGVRSQVAAVARKRLVDPPR
jgi:hypothetical protein